MTHLDHRKPVGQPLRIAVVDDDTVLREGIGALLPEVEVVATARSLDELLVILAEPTEVDVLVLDLNLASNRPSGTLQGRRAVKAAVDAGYHVLIYTNEQRRAVLAGCYLSGANALVHKTESLTALRDAISQVSDGRSVITASTAGLLEAIAKVAQTPALTVRQAQVLNGRARGETFAAIGRRLNISPRTAEEYMSDVVTKVAALVEARTPAEIERQLGLAPGDLMS